MKKILNKKALGIVALALVCVLAGTAIGAVRPTAEADTVVLTSPFTEAIAKVRDSVVGVYLRKRERLRLRLRQWKRPEPAGKRGQICQRQRHRDREGLCPDKLSRD